MRELSSILVYQKTFGRTIVPNNKINTTNTFEKKNTFTNFVLNKI